ncbi:hypothetical protein GGX14DRAFT_404353 [Mycena pura]|uniref:Uncharacterized protein n=1 Tax=Mycena pura TaxID=153505 RepID=A0AAD6UUU8_9AGAR|nr:hypothetical protein GGX14DRAFT_404353 [Mycena pura]
MHDVVLIQSSTVRSPSSYQNALDTCVRIQRVLRILLAWIERMPRYRSVQSNALVLRRMITAANDSYMGFWLNGGEERMTLALMHLGAPGFVLHEFMDGETDVPTSQLHDFLADSLESRTASPYDRVDMPSLPPIPVLLDEPGPSFFAQGPRASGTPLPEVVPPSLSAPTPPPPSSSSQQPLSEVYPYDDDVSDYGDRSPHAPPATKDTEWIQPPDIQNTSSSSKAWEKWWFDPDLQAFIRMGKHNKDVPGKAYFDRVLRRKLYIEGHDIPDGVWRPRDFGLPVPEVDFRAPSGNKWLLKGRSKWMYMHERPSEKWPAGSSASLPRKGKRADPAKPLTVSTPKGFPSLPPSEMRTPPPQETALPGPSDLRERGSEPEVPGQTSVHKGKGKAKEIESDETADGATKEEEGKREEERAERRSNIVVLDGLPEDLAIHDYLAMISDDLYRAEVLVFSAMNAQRRIWVQLFDFEAAERAIAVLPTAGGSRGVVAQFATLGEFKEHWTYAASQWDWAQCPSPMLPPRTLARRPTEAEDDDMVSLGDTPPPDDCMVIDEPTVVRPRSVSPVESPKKNPLAQAPLKPTTVEPSSDPTIDDFQRQKESTNEASERSTEPSATTRETRRELPEAPTFHDAPEWSGTATNRRNWLHDMLALPTRPSLEYRMDTTRGLRYNGGRTSAQENETSEEQPSWNEMRLGPSLASRMGLDNPGPSRPALLDRFESPRDTPPKPLEASSAEKVLLSRLSRRAVIPGVPSTRKTKRGTAGGAKNRLRREKKMRRQLEDALAAADGTLVKRLWAVLSEEGNRDASTLMPSMSNQGEETVDTGMMHEEEEADGDDDADEEDFDMDF